MNMRGGEIKEMSYTKLLIHKTPSSRLQSLIEQCGKETIDVVKLWKQIRIVGKTEGFDEDQLRNMVMVYMKKNLLRLGLKQGQIYNHMTKFFWAENRGRPKIPKHHIVVSEQSWRRLTNLGAGENQSVSGVMERLAMGKKIVEQDRFLDWLNEYIKEDTKLLPVKLVKKTYLEMQEK